MGEWRSDLAINKKDAKLGHEDSGCPEKREKGVFWALITVFNI
jgi:hypothetical protein